MKAKLNVTLRRALANSQQLPSDDYYELLRIVGQIAQQHEEVDKDQTGFSYIKLRNNNNNDKIGNVEIENPKNIRRELSASGKEYGAPGTVDTADYTFMGGLNMARVLRGPNGKPLRAKWKNQEQISKLRSEGKCFRCERKGCNTRVCRLLPARKPDKKGIEINVSEYCNLDPSLYEEDDGNESSADNLTEN